MRINLLTNQHFCQNCDRVRRHPKMVAFVGVYIFVLVCCRVFLFCCCPRCLLIVVCCLWPFQGPACLFWCWYLPDQNCRLLSMPLNGIPNPLRPFFLFSPPHSVIWWLIVVLGCCCSTPGLIEPLSCDTVLACREKSIRCCCLCFVCFSCFYLYYLYYIVKKY